MTSWRLQTTGTLSVHHSISSINTIKGVAKTVSLPLMKLHKQQHQTLLLSLCFKPVSTRFAQSDQKIEEQISSIVCFFRWSSPSSCSSSHLGEPALSPSTTSTTTVAPRRSFCSSSLVLPTSSSSPCRRWSWRWATGDCAPSSSPFSPSDWLALWWATET